jgi:hypothetical protein
MHASLYSIPSPTTATDWAGQQPGRTSSRSA